MIRIYTKDPSKVFSFFILVWLLTLIFLVLQWYAGYGGEENFPIFRRNAVVWVANNTLPILILCIGIFVVQRNHHWNDRQILNTQKVYFLYFILIAVVPIAFNIIGFMVNTGIESSYNEIAFLKDSYWLFIPLQLSIMAFVYWSLMKTTPEIISSPNQVSHKKETKKWRKLTQSSQEFLKSGNWDQAQPLLKELVSNNQQDSVIALLIPYCEQKGQSETSDTLRLLKMRWNNLEEEINLGTLSREQIGIERARINKALMNVINETN